MATKKKVLSDQDYEEFNKMMAEYEADPNSCKIEFYHDDGSLWYQGMRGGYGGRDYVRHRLVFPANPFSVKLESEAISRFKEIARNATISDELYDAFNKEIEQITFEDGTYGEDDAEQVAALNFFLTYELYNYEDIDDTIVELCPDTLDVLKDVALITPIVYDQYVVTTMDIMSESLWNLNKYEETEKWLLAALDICRQDMLRFSLVDWKFRTINHYWLIGKLYQEWDKPNKAIAYCEEGWRTFTASETPVAKFVVHGIADSLCQLYEQCGMSDKLQKFRAEIEEYSLE